MIEELEQTCRLRTYLRLKDIVHRGLYDKSRSFYLNCRGCAWAGVSNALYLWKQYAVTLPALTVDIDAPITGPGVKSDDLSLADTLATHNVTKLCTKSDGILQSAYKRGKKHSLAEVSRGSKEFPQVWHAITEEQFDYYLQSCEEYGIEPLDHDAFIAKNFPPVGLSKRERALKRAKEKWIAQQKKEQG
jgi:hypothetical protein